MRMEALSTVFATLLVMALLSSAQGSKGVEEGKFRAAVYEHQLIRSQDCWSGIPCSREEAILAMEDNINVYREQIKLAAEAGAELILLPEDGLGAVGLLRDTIEPFVELSPSVGDNPCTQDIWDPMDDYAKIEFSCLAQKHGIYVSVDFATYLPGCEECGDGPNCFYNTQMVFDKQGTVVGVYHKYNLWTGEDRFYNIDDTPNLVYFDTEFGRFGLLICEDLLWGSPTLDLVREFNVDTLLVPLYWWDLFPHQLAHSAEDAWARGLQVNLLAANINSPSEWNTGSGLYSPAGAVAYYHDVSEGATGKLLLADLDIHPRKSEVIWNKYASEHLSDYPASDSMFSETVYDDVFNLVPLNPSFKSAQVCTDDGSLCCLADYDADFQEPFSLGVFSGSHFKDGSVRGSFYMESCTVIKCDPKHSKQTCNQDISYDYDYLSRSQTVFKHLNISANFREDTVVYPEALFDGLVLTPEAMQISQDGVLGIKEQALVSLTLFGRTYSLDAPLPDHFCPSTV